MVDLSHVSVTSSDANVCIQNQAMLLNWIGELLKQPSYVSVTNEMTVYVFIIKYCKGVEVDTNPIDNITNLLKFLIEEVKDIRFLFMNKAAIMIFEQIKALIMSKDEHGNEVAFLVEKYGNFVRSYESKLKYEDAHYLYVQTMGLLDLALTKEISKESHTRLQIIKKLNATCMEKVKNKIEKNQLSIQKYQKFCQLAFQFVAEQNLRNTFNYQALIQFLEKNFSNADYLDYLNCQGLNDIQDRFCLPISRYLENYITIAEDKVSKEVSISIDKKKLRTKTPKSNLESMVKSLQLFANYLKISQTISDIQLLRKYLYIINQEFIALEKSIKSMDRYSYFSLLYQLLSMSFELDILILQIIPEANKKEIEIYSAELFTDYLFSGSDKSQTTFQNPEILKMMDDFCNGKVSIYVDQLRQTYPEIKYSTKAALDIAYMKSVRKEHQEAAYYIFMVLLDVIKSAANNQLVTEFNNSIALLYGARFPRHMLDQYTMDTIDIFETLKLASQKRIAYLRTDNKTEKEAKIYQVSYLICFWLKEIQELSYNSFFAQALNYSLFVRNCLFAYIEANPMDKNDALTDADINSLYKLISDNARDAVSELFAMHVLPDAIQESTNSSASAAPVTEPTVKFNQTIASQIIDALETLIKDKRLDESLALINEIKHQLSKLQVKESQNFLKSIINLLQDHALVADDVDLNSFKLSYLQTLFENSFEDLSNETSVSEMLFILDELYQDYIKNPQNLSESNFKLLTPIYKSLAEWHVKFQHFDIAVDLYNSLADIATIIPQSQESQEIQKDALKLSNQVMFSQATHHRKNLVRAIFIYDDIIENCDLLHDDVDKVKAFEEQAKLTRELVEKYFANEKYSRIVNVCDQYLNKIASNISQPNTNISESVRLLNEFKDKAALKLKEAQGISASIRNSLFSNLNYTSVKTKKKSSKPLNQIEAEPSTLIVPPMTTKHISDETENLFHPNAKVGHCLESTHMYPVLLNDIPDFVKLKSTNLLLYKRLKKAVLDDTECRKKGENGLKHLWGIFWEAKVNARSRLLGHLEGNKIIFDTFSKKGFHRR